MTIVLVVIMYFCVVPKALLSYIKKHSPKRHILVWGIAYKHGFDLKPQGGGAI